MSKRTAVVVAWALAYCLSGRLFAEQQERLSIADTTTGAHRTPQGLPNDNCEDAIPIFDGTTNFDTTGANTDGLPHEFCMFDGQTYHDIWFKYEPTCNGTLIVSTCGQNYYDTDIVVYGGCHSEGWTCPPGDVFVLGCNDDGCSAFASAASARPVGQGNCYMIRLGGWQNSDEGQTGLTVNCQVACGNGFCRESDGETACSCPQDCPGECPFCGDLICQPEAGENGCSCPQDCPNGCPCEFFTNQVEFEMFNAEHGKTLIGIEDFEESTLPPGASDVLDDPLCGGVPNLPDAIPFAHGLDLQTLCVQSNHAHPPTLPDPYGTYGLVAHSGAASGVVLAFPNFDSLDLIFDRTDITAVGFNTVSVPYGDSVVIQVFKAGNQHLTTVESPADATGANFWGISCESSIGRVNLFEWGNREGADNIQLWVNTLDCGECLTDVDGSGDTDAADLAVLLGAWGPCPLGAACSCLDANDDGTIGAEDLAVLLGAWGPCE